MIALHLTMTVLLLFTADPGAGGQTPESFGVFSFYSGSWHSDRLPAVTLKKRTSILTINLFRLIVSDVYNKIKGKIE